MTNYEERGERQRCCIGSAGVRIGVGLAILSILGIVVAFMLQNRLDNFWSWLTDGESGSATLRNLGLLVLATIGMPFAIWRSVVAGRQADIAQRGLRNETYQKAVAMLADSVLAVRLGGIYALQHLAKEHPTQYHIQVMRLFCAFIRHPTALSNTHVAQNEIAEVIDLCGAPHKWTHVKTSVM